MSVHPLVLSLHLNEWFDERLLMERSSIINEVREVEGGNTILLKMRRNGSI